MADIPTASTAGALAKVLGVSERIIASRKAAGRLPVLAGGAVDLHAVVRAGAATLLQQRPAGGGATDLTAAEAFDDGLRAAASTTAHLIVTRIAQAGPGADVGKIAATALAEALDMTGVAAGEPVPSRLKPMAAA